MSWEKVIETSRIDSEGQVSANQRLNHAGMGMSYCTRQSWEKKI